jgi:hypothetical protein
MRHADSNTFLAGDGRLVTKIYPFAVNYPTRSGAMAAIDTRLVPSAGGFAQAANDLGLRFPGMAAGRLTVSGQADSVSLSLLGASGNGSVSGSVETFANVLSGVSLSYSSLDWGAGWRATLSDAAAHRGLRWLLRASSGLSARMSRGGIEVRDRAGRVVSTLGAPTAVEVGSAAPLRTRLSLSQTATGAIITETVPALGAANRPAPTSGARTAAATATPKSVVLSGTLFPGEMPEFGASALTGDCYVDSQTPTTSTCQTSTNFVGANDHTLLNFNVAASLPSHVQVLQSFVSMQLSSESATSAESVGVWQAAKPWTNRATWDAYDGTNAWAAPGGDTTGAMADMQNIGISTDVGQNFYWDINSSMQGWVDGNPSQDDGLLFALNGTPSKPNRLGFLTET